MNATVLLQTARFIDVNARGLAKLARESQEPLDDAAIRDIVQGMYGVSKRLMDQRAKLIAAAHPPAPTVGSSTNIGDPLKGAKR